ncbi:MAG: GtrA family protein [Lachnospiraceae bacterium]|nr:GtrA family protein [Lachnospiraceae bacterium]
MDFWKEIYGKYKEFINYSVVGVSLTLANWFIYSLCVQTMPMVMANLFSWIVVVILAYVGNKMFVFESRDWEIRTVIREAVTYFGARSATGIVEIAAQPILYHMGMDQAFLGVDGLMSKIVVSILVMVLNYSCTKLLVFRQESSSSLS